MAASMLLFSCKKESVAPPLPPVPQPAGKQIVTSSSGNMSAKYEYYADGKVKQVLNFRPWGNYTNKYTYQAGKVLMDVYNDNGKKTEMYEMFLNAKGFMEKIVYTAFDNSGNPAGTSTSNLFYNAAGLLESYVTLNGGSSKYYYNNDRNLIKNEYYDNNQQLASVTTYGYGQLDDKFPVVSYLTGNDYSWFCPPLSTKLVTQIKRTDLMLNKVVNDVAISYQLDADGYVLKGMVDELLPGTIDWTFENTFDK